MGVPNLKRVKVSSEQDLRNWLGKQPVDAQSVMLVTCCDTCSDKYLSREQVGDALDQHGWVSGFSYTLNGNLLGHVINKRTE